MPPKGYTPKGSTKGRKPKPTVLHVLNGNPSKIDLDARITNEPKFEKISPDCPDWLDLYAKEEWDRLAPELEKLGLLAQVDLAAFAAYCSNYSTWRQADEIIKLEGLVIRVYEIDKKGEKVLVQIKKHPAVSIRSDAFEKMKAFLIEFGFTPASRSRVGQAIKPSKPEKKNGNKKVGGLLSR